MPEDPPYRRIADVLRERIRVGAEGYQPGDRIPGEDALAREFDVVAGTARAAVDHLRSAGLVRSVSRSGTFVKRIPPVRRATTDRFRKDVRERDGGRGAFDVEMRAMGLQGVTRWLHLGPGPCPGDDDLRPQESSAQLLGVQPGETVMVRARHMLAAPLRPDGTVDQRLEETLQVATSYVPWDIAVLDPRIIGEDTGVGGLYSRLADVGHRPVRGREFASARVGTDQECELLGLAPASIVQVLDRQAFNADGRVVEICRHVMPPGYFVVITDFPMD